MTASASQWLWNLILTRFTPNLIQALKEGGVVSRLRNLVRATTDGTLSSSSLPRSVLSRLPEPSSCQRPRGTLSSTSLHLTHCRLLMPSPSRSLEDMDIIFGAITQEQRDADIARRVENASGKAEALEQERDHDVEEKATEARTERL